MATVARYAGRELLPRETGAALSAVAERVVREAVEAAAPDLPFAVIGMGKLGARELNVASDLDVMFVYEGEGPEDQRAAIAAAERVMRGIRDGGLGARRRPASRRAAAARSRGRSPGSSSTGSATRRRGSSSRCCGRARWRATPTWAAGSS